MSTRADAYRAHSVVSRPFDAELAVATAAARQAGAIQRDLFERLESITPKGKRDVVTEADFRSETAIIGAIRAAFPSDAIVSEESGALGVPIESAIPGPSGWAGAARTWFIDPLDGTVNFANGIPFYCASIGFALDGVPVVGVVYDPSRDELLEAARGHGAWRDGQPFRAGTKGSLEECLVAAVPSRGFVRLVTRVRPRVRAVRDLGSAALGIAYVGGSRFDAYVQPRGLSSWDVCAAGLIAEEGGTRVTAFDGGPWFSSLARPRGGGRPPSLSMLAAAPRIHDELLALLDPAARS